METPLYIVSGIIGFVIILWCCTKLWKYYKGIKLKKSIPNNLVAKKQNNPKKHVGANNQPYLKSPVNDEFIPIDGQIQPSCVKKNIVHWYNGTFMSQPVPDMNIYEDPKEVANSTKSINDNQNYQNGTWKNGIWMTNI